MADRNPCSEKSALVGRRLRWRFAFGIQFEADPLSPLSPEQVAGQANLGAGETVAGLSENYKTKTTCPHHFKKYSGGKTNTATAMVIAT